MHQPKVDFKYVRDLKTEVKAVGITYLEEPNRYKNVDDCQQIGVKFERTFLKFPVVDSNNSPEIKHILNTCQFQEGTKASLYGDFNHSCTVELTPSKVFLR